MRGRYCFGRNPEGHYGDPQPHREMSSQPNIAFVRFLEAWYNCPVETYAKSKPDLDAEIARFVEKNRGMCLWFAPKGYLPANDAERLVALASIERHGDREALKQARELTDRLLRLSQTHLE